MLDAFTIPEEAKDPRQSERSLILWIILLGAISRILVLSVGFVTYREDENHQAFAARFQNDAVTEAELRGEPRLVRAWSQWDAKWYARIARDGYTSDQGKVHPSMAFLPLLPLIEWTGSKLGMDRFWVGLIVPNVAFVVGLTLLGLVAFRVTGDRRIALRACVLLMAYPWAFYFSAPYNESISLALCSGALLAWLSRRPLATLFCLGIATASRLSAAALSAGIVLDWASDKFHGRKSRPWSWPVALLGVSGALAFFCFLYLQFGDATLQFQAQRLPPWSRMPPRPINLFLCLVNVPTRLADLKDYLAMLFFLTIGIYSWIKRGSFWGCLILVPIVQGMTTGSPMSIARFALASAPAFIELSILLRNRYVVAIWLILNLAVQAMLIRNFVNVGS